MNYVLFFILFHLIYDAKGSGKHVENFKTNPITSMGKILPKPQLLIQFYGLLKLKNEILEVLVYDDAKKRIDSPEVTEYVRKFEKFIENYKMFNIEGKYQLEMALANLKKGPEAMELRREIQKIKDIIGIMSNLIVRMGTYTRDGWQQINNFVSELANFQSDGEYTLWTYSKMGLLDGLGRQKEWFYSEEVAEMFGRLELAGMILYTTVQMPRQNNIEVEPNSMMKSEKTAIEIIVRALAEIRLSLMCRLGINANAILNYQTVLQHSVKQIMVSNKFDQSVVELRAAAQLLSAGQEEVPEELLLLTYWLDNVQSAEVELEAVSVLLDKIGTQKWGQIGTMRVLLDSGEVLEKMRPILATNLMYT